MNDFLCCSGQKHADEQHEQMEVAKICNCMDGSERL